MQLTLEIPNQINYCAKTGCNCSLPSSCTICVHPSVQETSFWPLFGFSVSSSVFVKSLAAEALVFFHPF